MSLQPPLNIPLDMSLPTRWTRSSSTNPGGRHQSLLPGTLHKAQDELHPAEGRSQKLEELWPSSQQKEMAEKHVSGKQDNAQEQVNELKIGSLPENNLESW